MEMARNLGFEVVEARISLEDIGKYDYSFITGSAREIGGIGSIDLNKSVIRFPDPEEKVRLLQSEFAKLVGK
jgi:branched-subunit amino acid aminotransferase/4-amino-4-deoxychorismate lyase